MPTPNQNAQERALEHALEIYRGNGNDNGAYLRLPGIEDKPWLDAAELQSRRTVPMEANAAALRDVIAANFPDMAHVFDASFSLMVRPNLAATHRRQEGDYTREYHGAASAFMNQFSHVFDKMFGPPPAWNPLTVILPSEHGGPGIGVGPCIFNFFVTWYSQNKPKSAGYFSKTVGSIGSQWQTFMLESGKGLTTEQVERMNPFRSVDCKKLKMSCARVILPKQRVGPDVTNMAMRPRTAYLFAAYVEHNIHQLTTQIHLGLVRQLALFLYVLIGFSFGPRGKEITDFYLCDTIDQAQTAPNDKGVIRLAITRLAITRLAITRLAITRLAIIRLAIIRLVIIRLAIN